MHPVPQFCKTLKKIAHVRSFEHQNSVFKDWRQDDVYVAAKAVEHDSLYWKVDRFKTPDGRGSAGVDNVIKEYWPQLNDWFLSIVSIYGFPSLDLSSLRHLFQSIKLIDNDYTPSMIELDFGAVNYEKEDMDNNPDKRLCRFEFWEILIRAAKRKYLDTGKETNLSVALARLIKNHILTQVIKTEMKDSWS